MFHDSHFAFVTRKVARILRPSFKVAHYAPVSLNISCFKTGFGAHFALMSNYIWRILHAFLPTFCSGSIRLLCSFPSLSGSVFDSSLLSSMFYRSREWHLHIHVLVCVFLFTIARSRSHLRVLVLVCVFAFTCASKFSLRLHLRHSCSCHST